MQDRLRVQRRTEARISRVQGNNARAWQPAPSLSLEQAMALDVSGMEPTAVPRAASPIRACGFDIGQISIYPPETAGSIDPRSQLGADHASGELGVTPRAPTAAPSLHVSPPLSHPTVLQRAGTEQPIGREGGPLSPELAERINARRGRGAPLDADIRARMEDAFDADLSGVRIDTDGEADLLNRSMGARAFTTGSDIFLRHDASPADRHLLAHELTHVVQQRSGVLPEGVGRTDDAFEHQAAAVADRVAAGESVVDLLPATAHWGGATPSAVQRQHVPSAPGSATLAATPAAGGPFVEVEAALNQPDPIAGVGDFHRAFQILNGLSMADMLQTLTQLQRAGHLDLLFAHQAAATDFDQNRLFTAMRVVRLNNPSPMGARVAEIGDVGQRIFALPADQQQAILNYAVVGRNAQEILQLAQEGQAALGGNPADAPPLGEPGASLPGVPLPMAGVTGGPIGPGQWNPGNSPISFYIGLTAHLGIAAYYLSEHASDVVFTNFTNIPSIVRQTANMRHPAPSSPPFGPPSPEQMAGKPDIANMTRHHIYEIKPQGSEAAAVAEAEWYAVTFAMQGVEMTLGPVGEPGTSGFFYDAGWYFIFETPAPGAIIYYRRARSPQDATETSDARDPSRIRLPQLTPEQQRQMATNPATVGTIGLIMLMILLLPVGA